MTGRCAVEQIPGSQFQCSSQEPKVFQMLPYLSLHWKFILAASVQSVHSGNSRPDYSCIVSFNGRFMLLYAAGVMTDKTIGSNLSEYNLFLFFLIASGFHISQNVIMRMRYTEIHV